MVVESRSQVKPFLFFFFYWTKFRENSKRERKKTKIRRERKEIRIGEKWREYIGFWWKRNAKQIDKFRKVVTDGKRLCRNFLKSVASVSYNNWVPVVEEDEIGETFGYETESVHCNFSPSNFCIHLTFASWNLPSFIDILLLVNR